MPFFALEAPAALLPFIGVFRRHFGRQITPDHRTPGLCRGLGVFDFFFRQHTVFRGHDRPGLCAERPKAAHQRTGINIGNRHGSRGLQIIREAADGTEIAHHGRRTADDETGRRNAGAFLVLRIHTDVADMGVRQRHDLPRVTRVSKDFLIPRHRGIEHNLCRHRTGSPQAAADENGPVGKRQSCLRSHIGLNGVQHFLPVFARNRQSSAG